MATTYTCLFHSHPWWHTTLPPSGIKFKRESDKEIIKS